MWLDSRRKLHFELAVESVTQFLNQVPHIPPSKTLTLWARKVASSTHDLAPALRLTSSGPALPRLPAAHSGSAEAFEQARMWLNECKLHHPSCRRSLSKLPLRILDIGSGEGRAASVSLHLPGNITDHYAALSYTWGISDRLVTRKRDPNVQTAAMRYPSDFSIELHSPSDRPGCPKDVLGSACANDIPLAIFPAALRDAIHIAKELGIRYLWIDSLCIIQGDDDDWADQGCAMADIYGNATVVICAASITDNSEPVLENTESYSVGICSTRALDGSSDIDLHVCEGVPSVELETNHISTRGWVFQERLVSTATLHYTKEALVWECAGGTFANCDYAISADRWKEQWTPLASVAQGSSFGPTKPAKSMNLVHWYDWISAYSARNLFDPRDKLPAFAGIAKVIAKEMSVDSDAYIAGLWKQTFFEGLLWRRHDKATTLTRSKETFIAPSWSWASVTGRLMHRKASWVAFWKNGCGPVLRNCHSHEATRGSFGRVTDAFVCVEGMFQETVIDRAWHPGTHKKPHQACGVYSGFCNNANILCTLDEYEENAPRYLSCWFLWLGTFKSSTRASDAFLILERDYCMSGTFRRIGYAEADGWFDGTWPTPNSGRLESPQKLKAVLR